MFPSFSPTSLPLISHHQNGNHVSNSPLIANYNYNNVTDEFIDFEDNYLLDNYNQSLIYDHPSFQDPTDPSDFATTKQQNLVLKDDHMITEDHHTSCFSTDDQHHQYFIQVAAGSRSSHNSINNFFVHPPNNFHIDDVVMREKENAGLKFALRMKTKLEVVYDGYKWRKYGKKKVKSSPYPRNYFKCSSIGCNVKKRIERDANDSSYVVTTYHGVHNHASSS